MKWAEIWGRIGPPSIAVYADFIDPFCYVGFHNVRLAAQSANVAIQWCGFELNPETPLEGSILETADNSDLRPGMWASVENFAKKSGLSLVQPHQVPSTRLAHLWVQSLPKGDVKNSLIERIYQAYLSDKKDIGNREVLMGLAGEIGLPAEPLNRLSGALDPEVLEGFRKKALEYRFPGVPGFVYRSKTYFGALSQDAWKSIIHKEIVCSTK